MPDEKKNRAVSRFLRFLLVTAGIFLAAAGLLVYAIDPYFHYHAPWFGLSAVQTEKEYQVPGALRHLDYDAVLAGSSVVENNDNSWYNEAFGVHVIKAVRSYGYIADLVWYLDLAFSSQHVGTVFFNLDPAAIVTKAGTTFEESGCPMYLYDDNPLNDVNYLFNSTVLFDRIPYMIAKSRSGYDEDLSYNWAEGKDFSKAGALGQYQRPKEIQQMEAADTYAEEVQGNIELLTQEIEKHPDTEFYFFIPPYSELWWDSISRNGLYDAYLWSEEQLMTALLPYDNVHLFDFQNLEEVVTNLDLYMDPIHFSPDINHLICEDMKMGVGEVTIDNLKEVLSQTDRMVQRILQEEIPKLEEEDAFTYEP